MSGERLKAERKRIGLNQETFASIAGVSRRAYAEWETGNTSPNVVQLGAFADAGVDVLYIVTGHRQGQGIGESAVYQAVLEAVDLLSLGKKLDSEQLAKAVTKLSAKAAAVAPDRAGPSTHQPRQVFNAKVGSSVNVEGNLKQTGLSIFGRETEKKK